MTETFMPRKKSPPPDRSATPGLTTADLLKWTNATKTNLIHWSSIGLIKPDVEESTGRGHHNRYSSLNMIEVQLASMMNRLHVPTVLMKYGLMELRDFDDLCRSIWMATPEGKDLDLVKFWESPLIEGTQTELLTE